MNIEFDVAFNMNIEFDVAFNMNMIIVAMNILRGYRMYIYIYTSRKARLWRASLLWHPHDGCCTIATP